MKIKSKAILLVLSAVLLVAASAFGTLAYLTDTETATNTFTVGKVAITLDEEDVDNDGNDKDNVKYTVSDGKYTVDANGSQTRDKANAYKLIPGGEYVKDPVIHVSADSESCWIFVEVENNISAIEDDTVNVAAQLKTNGWTLVDGETDVYAKSAQVAAGTDVKVFENIKVSGTVDNATLADYEGKTVTVTAYAVQAEGFADASAAWAATFGANK